MNMFAALPGGPATGDHLSLRLLQLGVSVSPSSGFHLPQLATNMRRVLAIASLRGGGEHVRRPARPGLLRQLAPGSAPPAAWFPGRSWRVGPPDRAAKVIVVVAQLASRRHGEGRTPGRGTRSTSPLCNSALACRRSRARSGPPGRRTGRRTCSTSPRCPARVAARSPRVRPRAPERPRSSAPARSSPRVSARELPGIGPQVGAVNMFAVAAHLGSQAEAEAEVSGCPSSPRTRRRTCPRLAVPAG